MGVLIKEAFSETRGVNPFPASLNVYVDDELITRKTLENIVLEIKAHDEIEDILLTGQGQLKDSIARLGTHNARWYRYDCDCYLVHYRFNYQEDSDCPCR